MALSHRARWALVVSALVTIALYLIPHGRYLAYPLVLISTLVHELGHGVGAELMGGDFLRFEMNANGSGVAISSGVSDGAARAFMAAGGLCGPAVAAALMMGLAARPRWARYALGAFGVALVLAMILVLRNGFGLAFTGILATLCLLIAFKAPATWAQHTLLFLAVQLALSVYSRGDYLFMKEARISDTLAMPSDSQNMALAMGFGSYWFWGALCALFSAVMLAAGAYAFWRGTHSGAVVVRPVAGGKMISPRAA
jgi:hypothetical protein